MRDAVSATDEAKTIWYDFLTSVLTTELNTDSFTAVLELLGGELDFEGVVAEKLASLPKDEREVLLAASYEVMRDLEEVKTIEDLKESAHKHSPTSNLAEVLALENKVQLEEMSRFVSIINVRTKKKAELVAELSSHVEEFTGTLKEALRGIGDNTYLTLRAVAEAGGSLRIHENDLPNSAFEVAPFPPYVVAFYEEEAKMKEGKKTSKKTQQLKEGIFTLVIPDGFLESISGIDWQTIDTERKELNRLAHITGFMVEICGLVACKDLLAICKEHVPTVRDLDYLLYLLGLIQSGAGIGMEIVVVNNVEEVAQEYLVESSLWEHMGGSEETSEEQPLEILPDSQTLLLDYLLERHASIPQRSYLEWFDELTPFEYVLQNPIVSSLWDFLCSHAPGGEDGRFADYEINQIIAVAAYNLEVDEIERILIREGLELEESEVHGLRVLLKDAFDHMPSWLNNGWTNAELLEQGLEPGKSFTASQIWPPAEQVATPPSDSSHEKRSILTPQEQDRFDEWFHRRLSEADNYSFDEEADIEAINEENEQLMEGFDTWLANQGLSEKTIYQHYNNVYFFLEHFLANRMGVRAVDGDVHIWSFLDDWFIRKAMWSSPASIKSNAASLKKFYKYLEEAGISEPGTYKAVCLEVKAGLPTWLQSYEDLYGDLYDSSTDDWW